MGKIIFSFLMVVSMSFSAEIEKGSCATQEDKNAFNVMSLIGGTIIGGPFGVLFAGSMWSYSGSVETCDTDNQLYIPFLNIVTNLNEVTKKTKEKTINSVVLNSTINVNTVDKDSKVNNKVKENNTVKNVYFKLNSYKITDSKLNKIKVDKNKIYTLKGYADLRGQESYNSTLSYQRAVMVGKYLSNKGISKKNIIIKIGGETDEFCKGLVESCYEKNRVVTIK